MKNLLKIVFTLAMLSATFSWGWVNEIDIRVCGNATDALNSYASQGYSVVQNNVAQNQDFLQGFGNKSPYIYMGYKSTYYVRYLDLDPDSYNFNLPITKIIVRNLGSNVTSVDVFDTLGARFYRLQIHDAYGRNFATDNNGWDYRYGDFTNNAYSPHIYIYYTRDDIDGKFVDEIEVVHGTQPASSNGVEKIEVNFGQAKGLQTYMYVRRSTPRTVQKYSMHPEAYNDPREWLTYHLYFNGKPQRLLKEGTLPKDNYILREEFKVGESGAWTTSFPTATNVGEYVIYTRLVSKSAMYYDYVYGPLTAKIYPPEVDFKPLSYTIRNQNGSTTDFYSGDRIYVDPWNDLCGRPATFYYENTVFSRTAGAVLKSGSYTILAKLSKNVNCPEETAILRDITVKKSKLVFNSNGGSSVAAIEGETGATYTKPTAPTMIGYSFSGWNPSLPSTIQRGEKTYTAQWNANQYAVTFDANGGKFSDGTTSKVVKQDYNTTFTWPPNPTRTDFLFDGWDNDITKVPAQNTTIRANWVYNRFKVNLPEQMEVVSGDMASDKTFAPRAKVSFRAKQGYMVWGNVTYNGVTVPSAENGIYTVEVLDKEASVQAKIAKVYGAIQIAVDGSKAIIDGNSDKTSEVLDAVEVSSVEMTRNFERYGSTTITLPFTIDVEYVWGGIFCKFNGMKQNGDKWKVRLMFVSTILEANTPYVFVPLDEHISIDLPFGEKVSIQTEEKSVADGLWNFKSVYSKRTWIKGEGDQGRAYGFKPSNDGEDGVSGSFVKIGDGSTLYPMRAYLVRDIETPMSRPAMSSENVSRVSQLDLPEELEIEVVSESEKPMAMGKLNTVTGKVKIDYWFDMKGRRLNGPPKAKGVYLHNKNTLITK